MNTKIYSNFMKFKIYIHLTYIELVKLWVFRLITEESLLRIFEIKMRSKECAKSEDFKSFVFAMAEYGRADILKMLMKIETKLKLEFPLRKTMFNYEMKINNDETLLHVAAISGHINVAKLLISSGIDPNVSNLMLETPLHYAAKNNQMEMLDFLIENGAKETIDYIMQTPLMYGILNSYGGVCDLTLLKHMVTKFPNNLQVALTLAIDLGDFPSFATIINEGEGHYDINYLYEYEELTLLHKVSSRGFSDFVKLLLEKGADLDCRNKSCETPLYLAAWHGQVEVVKLLLEAGADKISSNLYGTPYSVAYRKGYYEICDLLK